ncbi:MAG: ubiquitin-conjugating enzyme family protein [Candidatus Hodarchaeales archaeon]|jgi:ubiquitin-protein ligase
MLTEEEFLDRLMIEGQRLVREQPTFRKKGDWSNWRGEIIGSAGVYEGGVFIIDIIVPRDYPFKPPKVKWRTPTWHPNIYREQVCIGILGKDWTPVQSLVDLVEALRFLLTNPNPHDPLNMAASKQFIQDFESFKIRAREYVERYATWAQNVD